MFPSEKLSEYAQQCLDNPFEQSGLALQDIVNEIGRRLGYDVTEDCTEAEEVSQGTMGLWKLKNGRSIVIEVKTTDAYNINLEIIARIPKETGRRRDGNHRQHLASSYRRPKRLPAV